MRTQTSSASLLPSYLLSTTSPNDSSSLDVAKTFNVSGWFSPSTIKAKILLQRLWEQRVDWDDSVPSSIQEAWLHWRSELHLLSEKPIPRCYFDKSADIVSFELHGFCDASGHAYTAVVYLHMTTATEMSKSPW